MFKENEKITLSGYHYPNRIARIYFETLEDIMGENGFKSVLHLAGLDRYIGSYPPNDLERGFDFVEFSALNIALETVYGPRGGRGLTLRAGRAAFAQGLKNFGALAGASDLAFRVLPLSAKLKLGLPALASIFNNFSDQVTEVAERTDHYVYTIRRCPVCWGRTADKPICHGAVGLLLETLHWLSGGLEFKVVQTQCHAMGHEHCEFIVYKEPIQPR